jgi:hypothetical protein
MIFRRGSNTAAHTNYLQASMRLQQLTCKLNTYARIFERMDRLCVRQQLFESGLVQVEMSLFVGLDVCCTDKDMTVA